MNNINIKVKKLDENAKLPYCGSQDAAMWDLYANTETNTYIWPHKTELIGTGLAMQIPKDYWGGLFPRSGIATKKGLRLANCVGVIDSDYRGEIIVALHNHSVEERVISNGDRIAQIVFTKVEQAVFILQDEINDTERGTGGFGSTGSN